MTDYVGYLSIELDELQLAYHTDPVPPAAEEDAEGATATPELILVADIGIVDASNVFRWQSNGEVEVKTNEMTAFKKPIVEEEAVVSAEGEGEATEGDNMGEGEAAEGDNNTGEAAAEGEASAGEEAEVEKPVPKTIFTVGFSNVFQRTQFIDLNPEVIGTLANAYFVVSVRDAKAEAPAEGEPIPSLVSVKIPLSNVLKTPGCLLNETTSLIADSVKIDSDLISGEDSYLSWRVIGDNDLTEYCIGCTIIQWKGASLSAPPADWTLHYADVVDPKAKAPATDEELRAKYLEEIPGKVEGQETIATYTLGIGINPKPVKEAVEETNPDEAVGEGMDGEEVIEPISTEPEPLKRTMLPYMEIGKGIVKFDSEKAASVGAKEDIRSRTDLWSIEWGPSTTIFLHRSHIREYAGIMTNKYENASDFTTLPVTLTKTPTESGQAEEGEAVLTAIGSVDLSALQEPGACASSFAIDISGGSFDPEPVVEKEETTEAEDDGGNAEEKAPEGAEEEEKPVPVEKVLPSFSLDITLSAPMVTLQPTIDVSNTANMSNSRKSLDVSPQKTTDNRDVLKELKEEIVEAIKKVATEYVLNYPGDPNADPLNGSALDDRKAEFLYYLSSSGIYHSLKESLKPKIQRVVRAEYGKRGQAMASKAYQPGGEVTSQTDQLLAEVYVFLIKQCNQVLNTLYTTTIIDKDVSDTENSASVVAGSSVDDELEVIKQNLIRLIATAEDAEHDLRFNDAEQRLLERIQIILNSEILSDDNNLKGEAHFLLGDFYLRLSNYQQSCSLSTESNGSRQKAREALSVAASFVDNKAKANLLLACLFNEEQHIDRAEARFIQVIDEQLRASKDIALQLSALDSEFDGYESDKMGPVDPKTYAILACHFSRKGDKLKARKALRLANASYIEGNVSPTVDTHGSPRRTMVLFLANAGLWLNKHGFARLAKEALTLASSCDAAASAKANARGFMSNTPAFIRHLMKRLSACIETEGDPLAFAQESVSCSDDNIDKINGFLCAANISFISNDSVKEMEALMNALQVASEDSPLYSNKIPVSAYVQCCKLLISSGKYQEALAVSLTGSTVHTSSALLLQMGIAALRLGMVEDAEKALQESNLLDNRNGSTWAYHTLLCVQAGPRRAEESMAALHQALRLGVTSPVLLRELATAFMGVDKLQTAEELIRRCISVENEKGSFLTRKLLGDALAGQNQAAKAVEEYQTVITAEESPVEVKLAAAMNCVTLLKTLGRQEEYKAAKHVVAKLKEATETA